MLKPMTDKLCQSELDLQLSQYELHKLRAANDIADRENDEKRVELNKIVDEFRNI